MAKQKFGQHFLTDSYWKKKIVSSFDPPADFAEIGPGKGAITELLCDKYEFFNVFEIDRELAEFHRQNSKLHVIEGDFLKWNFELQGKAVQNFSFIGNLPYESGTKMIKQVCENCEKVSHFVFMLQKEVADRICAEPKNKTFGSLSVLVQAYFSMKELGVIPPKAFRPSPKVQSRVIIGNRRQDSLHPLTTAYWEFLALAFHQKRKLLKNNLSLSFNAKQIKFCYESLGLAANIRAEEISVDEWPKIFETLDQS